MLLIIMRKIQLKNHISNNGSGSSSRWEKFSTRILFFVWNRMCLDVSKHNNETHEIICRFGNATRKKLHSHTQSCSSHFFKATTTGISFLFYTHTQLVCCNVFDKKKFESLRAFPSKRTHTRLHFRKEFQLKKILSHLVVAGVCVCVFFYFTH